jgi:hypothetical protein
MRHFVQYHNCDAMGGPPAASFRVLTGKPVSNDIVGERVWLIVGEGENPNKRFFLHSTFIATEVADTDAPGFVTQVSGESGVQFDPAIALDDEHWFLGLLKQTGQFAFGWTELTGHNSVIGGLRTLAKC